MSVLTGRGFRSPFPEAIALQFDYPARDKAKVTEPNQFFHYACITPKCVTN